MSTYRLYSDNIDIVVGAKAIHDSVVALQTKFQAVAVGIITEKIITVSSLYLPPRMPVIQTDLDDLVCSATSCTIYNSRRF